MNPAYTSRVSQLDAVILDQEFYNFVKNQIINIFDKIQLSNWIQIYEAEFDFILSTIIWRLTVGVQNCTIGQRLLGLRYSQSRREQNLFYIINTILPYVNARIVSYILKRNDERAILYNKRIDTGLKTCKVINFCIFLMENKYLTLSHRLSGLRMVPATQRLPYPPGDSYQIRELLWHQFSDFLMIMVPFVNLHIVKRYWSTMKQYWFSSPKPFGDGDSRYSTKKQKVVLHGELNDDEVPNVIIKCCVCNQDAVLPQFSGKCSFCYFCLKSNQLADSEFKPTNCPHYTS